MIASRFSIARNPLRRFVALILAGTLALTTSKHANAQAITFDTVALTGQAVPGMGPGVSFDRFYIPVLNDAGQVAFVAGVTGTGVSSANDHGIFSGSAGTLGLVAREGSLAPGTGPGMNFSMPFGDAIDLDLNFAGATVFGTSLTTGVTGRQPNGVFTDSGGMLRAVARDGNAAPGTGPGVTFGIVGVPQLNDAGQIIFTASIAGTGVNSSNDRVIFSDLGGTLSLMAREGNAVPGAGTGINLGSPIFGLVQSNSGHAAFVGELTGTGVNFTNNEAVFRVSGAALELIAREDVPAPDVGAGVNFSSFDIQPALNNAGQIAFSASLSGTGAHDAGVFSDIGGALSLFARTGDVAPGTGPGISVNSFHNVAVNDTGQIAFIGGLTGPGIDITNDRGLFLESGGTVSLVVREGDLAPGLETGVKFGPAAIVGYEFNNAGQIAFMATLIGPSIDFTNNLSLFATNTEGNLKLVARKGDLFDVNSNPLISDWRTIVELQLVSNPFVGTPGKLNNQGQLAFQLGFSDGTGGIFIANIAVPEPASMALLCLGCLPLLGCRPRQCD